MSASLKDVDKMSDRELRAELKTARKYEAVFPDLCSLLDAIEQALDDHDGERAEELVKGRFDIIKKYGFKVEFTGLPTSGERH